MTTPRRILRRWLRAWRRRSHRAPSLDIATASPREILSLLATPRLSLHGTARLYRYVAEHARNLNTEVAWALISYGSWDVAQAVMGNPAFASVCTTALVATISAHLETGRSAESHRSLLVWVIARCHGAAPLPQHLVRRIVALARAGHVQTRHLEDIFPGTFREPAPKATADVTRIPRDPASERPHLVAITA